MVQTLSEMRETFPNQWILVEDPALEVATLVSGRVILNAPTKQELARLAKAESFGKTFAFYTGELPAGRRYLL